MEQTYSYFISQLVTQTPLFCTPGLKDLVRSPDPSCDVSVIECNFHSAPSRNHFSIPQGYAMIVISNFYYVTLDRKRWSQNKPAYLYCLLSLAGGLCLNSCSLQCSEPWPTHIISPREWRHKLPLVHVQTSFQREKPQNSTKLKCNFWLVFSKNDRHCELRCSCQL